MMKKYFYDFLEYSGLIFITWYFGVLDKHPGIVVPLLVLWIAEGELQNLFRGAR